MHLFLLIVILNKDGWKVKSDVFKIVKKWCSDIAALRPKHRLVVVKLNVIVAGSVETTGALMLVHLSSMV